jgi:hypothetical protein
LRHLPGAGENPLMKVFAAAVTIRATPERIWNLLTNAAGYPRWNHTVERIDGRIALGERITVVAKINPGRSFPVTVAEFDPARRMVWRGGMPMGLFRGERTFLLRTLANGEVEFSMREEFTGLLAPLIGRSIPDLQPAFEEFSQDLKRAAEGPLGP